MAAACTGETTVAVTDNAIIHINQGRWLVKNMSMAAERETWRRLRQHTAMSDRTSNKGTKLHATALPATRRTVRRPEAIKETLQPSTNARNKGRLKASHRPLVGRRASSRYAVT